ncbi:Stk1 family PASTA domain-containing Ser/Thr kinase [Carnobacterium sp. ISL-102]|uniref:Stk1 family PASTA domain-containing Ser/Thr kinase n=1 Tax=Carnobacterium sp. ISL-102 TaxID=2819142 RepID=UPI001BEBEF8A|nr:Stk1 family PASTA domain-containing Ser/Thr kinase [Carnobacterium sp. ISL-102]MBT2731581.1 Stk1 family PASTA domain-containing Ser/Thr kinase [Carnobacterium sp. ISL-102]
MEKGKKLNGRYKIIRSVGSGGMANVYLARDLILERDVAVKVLRFDFRDDQNTIRRFKREALAATELIHPNIVSVYDVGEEENNQYIVMEYIKGMDLKHYIHSNFPIPYQKVLDIMRQILAAVEEAHKNRIIHRDLKPQNVLIDESGVVKITDFGIAVALSQTSITQTNSLLGSVHYLSPEQARGGMATNQSDIYSLGIILYELLTGNVPFEGESAVSIALKHFQESLPSVKDFDHRIPQSLENVVLKATAKETIDRYRSVQEMASDLETSLSPQRIKESKFIPASLMEKTKILQPIIPVAPIAIVDAEEKAPDPKNKKQNNETNKDTKPKKKKRKIFWLTLLLLLLIITGSMVAFALTAPKDVLVPDVAGMSKEEAENALLAVDLYVNTTIIETSEDVKEGLVTRTDPEVDSSVKEETDVNLYISSGKETVSFKDYTGEPYEEVRAELIEQGFITKRIDESSNTFSEGSIIEQSIDEDEEVVPSETTVTLTVSTGEAKFEMKDLTGYSEKGVQDYANEKGLTVTINKDYSGEVSEGQVISQDPPTGELLSSGASISVVISLGEKPEQTFSKTVTIPYAEPKTNESEKAESESGKKAESGSQESTPIPNDVVIYIEDNEHTLEDEFQKFTITEDFETVIPFVLQEGDTGTYRIERDGEIIEENTKVTAE